MENNFGVFFKQKRNEKNLTQKDLAKLLFVSESAVSKWESGVSHPDITLLPRISEIFGVTEHELITASIDTNARIEKAQARKWRTFSFSWDLFFYISYAVALIPCFICNLAIGGRLDWFFIVFSALLLSFTFTNLPKLIKRHKLILLPLSMYLALCLLLGVCCIYTGGNWFWVAALSVLFGITVVFTPIYICKYDVFSCIKKFADFISVAIDFAALNGLLIIINAYTVINGYSGNWYLKIAFPIVLFVYLFLNLLLSIRFLKTNRFLKTSVILFLIDILYLILPFVKVSNPDIQSELNEANVFLADLSNWQAGVTLEQNIHLIICLSILCVAASFLSIGLIKKRG